MNKKPLSPKTSGKKPQLIPRILYEDGDILAVDKPAGLLVHEDGKGGKKEQTLVDWIVTKYPQAKEVGEVQDEFDRSGIVHRLDKETSGIMLVAKTQVGFECLKKQFQNHMVKKTYHAFVSGTPRQSRGIIDHPIGKSATDFRARSAAHGARGETRSAQTQYMVKASHRVSKESVSFIQAMPKTGRTHQIRVHMKAIGHPIVGDSLYGKVKNTLGFARTALHSFSVEFKNVQGETVRVEAPYPADFETALIKIAK